MRGGVVDDKSADTSLDDIDSEVENVHQQNRDDDGGVADCGPGGVGAEKAEGASHELARPGEQEKRCNGGEGATDHEGAAFTKAGAALVGFYPDVRLDQRAREGPSDPDQGEYGFRDSEAKEIGRPVGQFDGPSNLEAAHG